MTNEDMDRKRLIQMHMLELTEEIDDLNGEEMTDERFWGALLEAFDDVFDYGRAIQKDENLDDVIKRKYLPYRIFHLFE